jgi:hypothetical protein
LSPQGSSDAWLYFYEEFLEVYDNQLRKQTGRITSRLKLSERWLVWSTKP